MCNWGTDYRKEWQPEEIESVVMALSAEAQLRSQKQLDERDAAKIDAGRKLIADDSKCGGCHKFRDGGNEGGPDLTGYGSREWLSQFISNPAHERFYGEKNDRMPAFVAHAAGSPQNILSQQKLDLIVDYLRGDWYEPEKPAVEPAK